MHDATLYRRATAGGLLPALPEGVLDELVKGPMTPSEVQDLMLAFNKAITERRYLQRVTCFWYFNAPCSTVRALGT
ncbi:hypothetical protein [Cupriavidus taiwanensis]|uniref:hypothetical protein n=1 Tax=Cupriavidus taiwanensis TaxID=164546 RepID=UPI0035933539